MVFHSFILLMWSFVRLFVVVVRAAPHGGIEKKRLCTNKSQWNWMKINLETVLVAEDMPWHTNNAETISQVLLFFVPFANRATGSFRYVICSNQTQPKQVQHPCLLYAQPQVLRLLRESRQISWGMLTNDALCCYVVDEFDSVWKNFLFNWQCFIQHSESFDTTHGYPSDAQSFW